MPALVPVSATLSSITHSPLSSVLMLFSSAIFLVDANVAAFFSKISLRSPWWLLRTLFILFIECPSAQLLGISSSVSAVPVAIEAVPASHGIDCNDTPFVGGAGPSVRGPS